MKRILFFLLICLFLSACASTSGENQKAEKNIDAPAEPALFADWQYRGFGQEYPYWAEEALKNKSQSNVTVLFGNNIDMLLHHEVSDIDIEENLKAETEETTAAEPVVAETWVYIDPYYEEYEERYAYIRIVEE